MARRSVRCLWFASALLLSACTGREDVAKSSILTEREAANAAFVSRWLSTTKSQANAQEAQPFLKQARAAEQTRNWSLAAKAFGESMLRYPDAQALAGYGHAQLRMLGEVRARDRNLDEHALADVRHVLAFYESAQAADAVLHTLPGDAAGQLRAQADCLQSYVESAGRAQDCAPLRDYLAGR